MALKYDEYNERLEESMYRRLCNLFRKALISELIKASGNQDNLSSNI